MQNDKRMVGTYEVINSIHIGDKEIALGENMNDPHGLFYMVCDIKGNEVFEHYYNILCSENFIEIAKLYGERVNEQITKTATELEQENVSRLIVTEDMCKKDIFNENLEGKLLVIKAEMLRPEYRTSTHQIMRCTGGNGSRPDGIGMSVFGDLLFSGKHMKYGRMDILGELKLEHYPEWINSKIKELDMKKKDHKEKER